MYKYTGLIKCGNCNHSFKARKERNNINYRCNYRQGKSISDVLCKLKSNYDIQIL